MLSVRCVGSEAVERMPEDQTISVLDVPLKRISLPALEASAPAKLARVLTHLGLGR